MTQKLNKLELTWIGKDDERPAIEPRILIEDPTLAYGEVETGTLPNGKPWPGNMLTTCSHFAPSKKITVVKSNVFT